MPLQSGLGLKLRCFVERKENGGRKQKHSLIKLNHKKEENFKQDKKQN